MGRSLKYFLLIICGSAIIIWFDLISYGLRQLKGQLNIVNSAVEIEAMMRDPAVADSTKEKLKYIESVRRYAIDSLGLKNSRNYTTYYDQKGTPSIWVITACEPFNLKAYEWKFPFLGAVAYKGFFDRELGLPELQKLRNKGYDVEYNPTGGWSTLGWFRDPVLSNMLRRNKGQLAELIIHELTHATVFIEDDVEFNENLATFVGEQGAKQFLQVMYGEQSPEYMQYIQELQDEQTFGKFMVDACTELQSFYDSLPSTLPAADKHLEKYRRIASIVTRIKLLPLNNMKRYQFDLPNDPLPNNTWFMGYKRYRGDLAEINKLFLENNSSIPQLLQQVKP